MLPCVCIRDNGSTWPVGQAGGLVVAASSCRMARVDAMENEEAMVAVAEMMEMMAGRAAAATVKVIVAVAVKVVVSLEVVEHVAAAAELGTEVEKETWAEMEAAKVVVVVAAA